MSKYDEMIRYLPTFYYGSLDVDEMMKSEGEAFDKFNADIYDVLDQFYIESATWGLDIWEREFAIVSQPNDSYEQRRARLRAKITGTGTFTPADAQALANQFNEPKTAEYIRIPNKYQFKIRHNVDHLIDFKGMIKAFEEMKPAHLRHINGLLINTDMYAVKEYMKIKGWAVISYPKYAVNDSKIYMKVQAGYSGTSSYIHDTWTPFLVLNGAWSLDGSQKLDGINDEGAFLYHSQSTNMLNKIKMTTHEILSQLQTFIKMYVPVNVKWDRYFWNDHEATLKMKTGYNGFSNIIDDSYSSNLTLNGAWKLDGSTQLNGVNAKGTLLYSEQADKLTIRTKNNNILVSTEQV